MSQKQDPMFSDYPADAPVKTYVGGCHCRKFTFEFDYPADFAVRPPSDCNCSVDAMTKPLWIYGSQSKNFRVRDGSAPLDALTKYVWNHGIAARQFCPTCGTLVLWTGVSAPFIDRIGINVRVLDHVDGDAIEANNVDGKKLVPGVSPLEREKQAGTQQGPASASAQLVV